MTGRSHARHGIAGAAGWVYLWGLSLSLLLQGLIALAFAAIGQAPPLLDAYHLLTHPAHSLLHAAWAGAMLAYLLRRPSDAGVMGLNLVFGAFYTSLALYVAAVGSPPLLEVTPAQNTFHFVAGPAALAFGIAAWIERRVWHTAHATTSAAQASPHGR
jgi:hypothetical protein